MSISLKQMRYALAVEQHKHFGRAALSSFVTQPALSQQITLLEDQLGFAIFERMGKSVIPTPQGKPFLDEVKTIVGQSKALEERFTKKQHQMPMRLSMALIPTIAPYLLPSLLPGLSSKFAPVQFSVSEQTTEQLVDAVKKGDCDFGILATDPGDDRLFSLPLFADPFVLAVAPKTSLTSPIDLAVLDREHMLLLSDGHCLRDQTMDACQLGNDLKHKTFAATSLSTIVELVANEQGMTLLPAISLKREAIGGRVKTLSLKQPGAGRTVSMIWRKSSPLQDLFNQIAAVTTNVGKQLLAEDAGLLIK
ncbi:hydrogen peroxide-inducible genes activator [uncultured Maritalea sp.]|uniref:hydrogen peroxide-inducible genes activator n=1 Tax=uncultured Maritalea sp. TaxID=757249 RepID=UPI002624ABEB|nr:hydrogen peroxide-inducible genes activator [uncultured Maritalea sp.]